MIITGFFDTLHERATGVLLSHQQFCAFPNDQTQFGIFTGQRSQYGIFTDRNQNNVPTFPLNIHLSECSALKLTGYAFPTEALQPTWPPRGLPRSALEGLTQWSTIPR